MYVVNEMLEASCTSRSTVPKVSRGANASAAVIGKDESLIIWSMQPYRPTAIFSLTMTINGQNSEQLPIIIRQLGKICFLFNPGLFGEVFKVYLIFILSHANIDDINMRHLMPIKLERSMLDLVKKTTTQM